MQASESAAGGDLQEIPAPPQLGGNRPEAAGILEAPALGDQRPEYRQARKIDPFSQSRARAV
jgi:hypothetical protein